MDIDLSTLTLASALEEIRNGALSPRALAEACLGQIGRLNPTVNAFLTVTRETALEQAEQAELLVRRSPDNLDQLKLLGIPLAVKDLFETAGVRTTAGSLFFKEYVPSQDAEVVLRLKQSAAVLLGKTHTHEIALGVTMNNPHFGPCRNPWDPSCIPGGSSGGSAVAVATGMCLGALGTDTGGSIRIPSALCGVVGLKPTYGRVSLQGVFPLSWNLDHAGPIARTVGDVARLFAAIAGFDPHDPASANVPVEDCLAGLDQGVKGFRMALGSGDYIEAADPEVLAAFEQAGRVFRELGARLEKVDLAWMEAAAEANRAMTQADAAAYYRQHLEDHPDWFGADVLERLRSGAALSAVEYSLVRRTQSELKRTLDRLFEKYDLLLLPSTPIPAPKIEGTQSVEAARQLTRFTAPFNLTGVPALSVPCGITRGDLPIGLQIVAKPWAEARVLQAGRAFEQATEWHTRFPDL
jgi:aspartyl-tRNA(Asn)/glutamyl-tRNA(Gln) amidotransferase subunit A